METNDLGINHAVAALSALAHAGRLAAFRMLVEAGPAGLPAGEISRRLGMPANTLSSNLNILSGAGLIASRRNGRFIVYSADYARMQALLAFLIADCCGGEPGICAPLAAIVSRTCCEPASERAPA